MKLYEIPPNSKIKLHLKHTVTGEEKDEICDFKHVDGMYSLIFTPDGIPVHIGASTEVKLVDGVYEIV